jgi:uncharacterized GH25 family protein
MAVRSQLAQRRTLLAATLLLSVAPSLSAHEFWIEPTTFLPTPGKIVGIRARVGDGVLGDPVPRDPALLEQLVVATASGRMPVAGRDGADPAGLHRIAADGLHVFGYLGQPTPVELSAEKFNAYLQEEGLNAIATERARAGKSSEGVRELFTRCAKTLVLAGPANAAQRDRILGFPLELVAEGNPYTLPPGHPLTIKLLYRGQPLKGALVTAIRRKTGERLSARSDAAGRVKIVPTSDGAWLIKAVHMTAAPTKTEAHWVSFWASLTFELPPAEKPRQADPKVGLY